MKVLIAPDKFKHALDAAGVAAAIMEGVRAARPDAEIACCPLGDGGEGTGCVLAGALRAMERQAEVRDPLGRLRSARWWLCRDGTAIVEMAEASGLALLRPAERDPLRTTTIGTGELLRAAANAGATRVLLCVGGSATVDGGAGCLQALGFDFTDAAGHPMAAPLTGGTLEQIATVQSPIVALRLEIEILCDVDNPLLGPRSAARVFGPQKGASPAGVATLEHGLAHWARLLLDTFGHEVAGLPGTGASGGLPAGLVAAAGARLCSGFDTVARYVDLPGKLRDCNVCLTGEGRIDEQTLGGKVVAGVARLARAAGVPVVALAGSLHAGPGKTPETLARALDVSKIVTITPPGTPLDRALATTSENLRRAACEVLASWK